MEIHFNEQMSNMLQCAEIENVGFSPMAFQSKYHALMMYGMPRGQAASTSRPQTQRSREPYPRATAQPPILLFTTYA